jgi:hypothetical protein
MFEVMVRPTLPLLSEAPMIAIDFGERKTDSAILMNIDQSNFYNKAFMKVEFGTKNY